MDWITWYNQLAKPDWTPAPATIGLIWQILYPIIAITFGFVFFQAVRGAVPISVALPFLINLASNMLFIVFFHSMRNLPLASVDILIIWSTIVWSIIAIWPYYRLIAFSQIPYLTWVSIATVLQLSITWSNR